MNKNYVKWVQKELMERYFRMYHIREKLKEKTAKSVYDNTFTPTGLVQLAYGEVDKKTQELAKRTLACNCVACSYIYAESAWKEAHPGVFK